MSTSVTLQKQACTDMFSTNSVTRKPEMDFHLFTGKSPSVASSEIGYVARELFSALEPLASFPRAGESTPVDAAFSNYKKILALDKMIQKLDKGFVWCEKDDAFSDVVLSIVKNLRNDPDFYSARSIKISPASKRLLSIVKNHEKVGFNSYTAIMGSSLVLETAGSELMGLPLYALPAGSLALVGIMQFLRIKEAKKKNNNVQCLVPLNCTNALNLLRLKAVCEEISKQSRLIPKEFSGLDAQYIEDALLAGEIILAKKQRVLEFSHTLKTEAKLSSDDIDLKQASEAISMLETEWNKLYSRLIDFCEVTSKLALQTKATTLRRQLRSEVDGVISTAGNAAVSSEMLSQAREAQQYLVDTINEMQENGLFSLI